MTRERIVTAIVRHSTPRRAPAIPHHRCPERSIESPGGRVVGRAVSRLRRLALRAGILRKLRMTDVGMRGWKGEWWDGLSREDMHGQAPHGLARHGARVVLLRGVGVSAG